MRRRLERIKIRAPAKVNLFLNILRKRADGYHDLRSILQMVSLYDEIIIEPARSGLSLVCPGEDLPGNDQNLVIKAATLLARKAHVVPRLRMTLIKRIPIGAGLGGGSSDAAATLVALNRLWGVGYSRDELAKIGQALGSDVPFFLYGPTAFVTGRGERIIPVVLEDHRWIVLINPSFGISTAWVYRQLKPSWWGNPSRRKTQKQRQASWLTNFERNIKIQCTTKIKIGYSGISFMNDLERVTAPAYPVISEMKDLLAKAGAEEVLMSGSGPTVFGVFKGRGCALQAAGRLKREHVNWKIWTVKGLRRSPF